MESLCQDSAGVKTSPMSRSVKVSRALLRRVFNERPENPHSIEDYDLLIFKGEPWSRGDFRSAADIIDWEMAHQKPIPKESALVLTDPFTPNRYFTAPGRELQMRAIGELAHASGWTNGNYYGQQR